MSRRRVEFRLTMPGVGSWNGKWSGAGRNYSLVRRLNKADRERLHIADGSTPSWSYGWDDGWRARITARLVEPYERLPKSDGFCGYDWMVKNILRWGTTMATIDEARSHVLRRAIKEWRIIRAKARRDIERAGEAIENLTSELAARRPAPEREEAE